ncbi:AP-5 complex subunit sigma-1 [Dunckerocampus dactyliophorus]|uniref:AP-5 complex subunit sigma-1 n=1 Tax=Dunckerocampus dactyliophorus TaxID=161453 RepID=UPI0024058E52|nr:AP-5 complex subunit sigma-1 [Dunckerocampus dactyliophorus]
MVRCFIIHTVCQINALAPGESRVLYSRVFGPDEAVFHAGQQQHLNPKERRLLSAEKLAVVARQVHSAVSMSREASGRPLMEMLPGEEALALQEANSGVVRLRSGDPFSEEMSALWIAVQSLAFVMVCEPHENLILAEGTLRNLIRHCLEHLHMLGQGSEVLLKSNRIDVLLSRLLPHGQLLFLNHRFAQSLEKDVLADMNK